MYSFSASSRANLHPIYGGIGNDTWYGSWNLGGFCNGSIDPYILTFFGDVYPRFYTIHWFSYRRRVDPISATPRVFFILACLNTGFTDGHRNIPPWMEHSLKNPRESDLSAGSNGRLISCQIFATPLMMGISSFVKGTLKSTYVTLN